MNANLQEAGTLVAKIESTPMTGGTFNLPATAVAGDKFVVFPSANNFIIEGQRIAVTATTVKVPSVSFVIEVTI